MHLEDERLLLEYIKQVFVPVITKSGIQIEGDLAGGQIRASCACSCSSRLYYLLAHTHECLVIDGSERERERERERESERERELIH